MYILKNSYAEKILVALCYSGEFAYKSLPMLAENKQMLQRNARKLIKERYISVTGSGRLRTLHLIQKGRDFMKKRFPYLYDYYMTASDGGILRTGKGEEASLWRQHRMAETLVVLQKAGVYFTKNQKPNIAEGDVYNVVELPENLGFFYNSKEMKRIDKIARYKVSFTRVLGLLVTAKNSYAVYNTNEGRMRWNSQGENKAQVMMENILNTTFYYEEREKVTKAILYAKTMDVAYSVLTSRKGQKNAYGFEFLSFDNTYSDMYFLTLDDIGLVQTKMLLIDNWQETLNSFLFSPEERAPVMPGQNRDAVSNGKFMVNKIEFISGNLGKLKREVSLASFSKNYYGEVYALESQAKFLEKYLPENFCIKIIPIEKICTLFHF